MRVTLTGRPGRYRKFHDLVVLTFEHNVDATNLPKGVPAPDESHKLHYTVYVSHLQWRRVEKNLRKKRKPELIIEGIVAQDDENKTLSVYTTRITINTATKPRADSHKKQYAQKDGARNDSRPKPRAKESTHQRPKISIPVPTHNQPEFDMPDGISSDDGAKLRQLHTAAAQFRKKIEGLEAKPEKQRFGLEMTKKLLENTEKQISAIEKKYQ